MRPDTLHKVSLNLNPLLLCLFSLLCGATASTAAPAQTAGWTLPAISAPRLQQRLFDSVAAKTRVSFFIYTPKVYDAEPQRRFPVLYWLHGSGGGAAGVPRLLEHFDRAIVAGKIPPMLIVFPNGLTESMWCDSKDGKVPMEAVVVKELVPLVDATFRTLATREGRLLEGFSMGGYGAARLGFKYPDLFGAISLLGGGPLQAEFDILAAPRGEPEHARQLLANVFGGDQDYFKAQSPWLWAERNAAALRGRTRVRQAVGDRDEVYANNLKFDARLDELGIPHSFVVLRGVDHTPLRVLHALGEENWQFYREVFGSSSQP